MFVKTEIVFVFAFLFLYFDRISRKTYHIKKEPIKKVDQHL